MHLPRLGRSGIDGLTLGPNLVHVQIIHGPGRPDIWKEGEIEDLGITRNLLTNVGRDLAFDATIRVGINNGTNVATATSATSLSDTGEAWTTDLYKGWTVVAEETTNTPVYGNIGSNNATTLTIDSWKNADDSAGTTPGATCNYFIIPTFRPRYIGLSENTAAASAASTTLAGEITTGGCQRAVGTPSHTAGTGTGTLVKSFSVTGTFPAIHKIGLFSASNTTAAGILCYETVLNADANVISGDTLQVTWTLTISG